MFINSFSFGVRILPDQRTRDVGYLTIRDVGYLTIRDVGYLTI